MSIKRISIISCQVLSLFLGLTIALLTSYGPLAILEQYNGDADILPAILSLLLLLLVVIEIISWLNISDSTIHTVLLSASILMQFLFSLDMQNIYTNLGAQPNQYVFNTFNFLFFMCVLLSGLYFINYTYKIGLKKNTAIYLLVCATASLALYIGLEFINMQYIAYILYLATFTGTLSRIYIKTFNANSDDSTFYLSMTILHVTVSMQTCTELYTNNFINFVPLGYASSHVFLIIALFIFVYICFIVRTSREAYMASEYKLQLEKLRITMLREQINPHFIFNSLTAVKSLYHQNVEWGDHAMNLFSNHLRTNVEAIDKNLIPFEKELDNINDYVELENLKSSTPFNIIYDISCSNFYVPILSLQVYVENSIKYSKINNKDDGYIEISSYETDDEIIVEVNDNGVGFDDNKVGESSFGIKNSRERFALLMGSKVEIKSSLGEGTKVKIHIDKKFMIDEGKNENNNC